MADSNLTPDDLERITQRVTDRILRDAIVEGTGTTARYASFDDYVAREGAVDDDLQETIEAMLTAISRWVDRRLGVFPGGFAPCDSQTFIFYSRGRRKLWLRDDRYAYPLRAVDDGGIRPDYTRTGEYSQSPYAWDFDDLFIQPIPQNLGGEPARGIELRRIGRTPQTTWPYGSGGSVQITGDWGWSAVPPPITELVVKRARDMRDVQRGGAASNVGDLAGEAIQFSDDSWRMWTDIEARYSYNRARFGVAASGRGRTR